MKKLKLKLTIIGISLLSINAFAQDYVYNGIKNVDATIGMNNADGDSNQETVSEDCYDPANIGKTIQAQGCADLLIVNNAMLRNLVKTDGNYADTAIFTGQVTDMSYLFCNFNHSSYPECTLKDPIYSISNWNTENVTDMSYMFRNSSYNQPLNNWDVSNVTDMTGMFYLASNFNQPLNDWNVSNVTDMWGLFYYTDNFNQPLNDWDVSNVINMNNMFFYASNFNQPLNNWNTNSVLYMNLTFSNAHSFNQPLNNWEVNNVLTMQSMFESAFNFQQDISNWNVNNVTFNIDEQTSKPYSFDLNSGFENQTALQPNWEQN
tara:strand:+ start:2015 stop:2971 length:957 start_codon:yes stop_codon:yes gene_type:complete